MDERLQTCLMWEGETTLAQIRALTRLRESFELQLPPDFHFTLFRHLYPNAAPAETEAIDTSGGAELLERVAEIQGLGELAEVIEPIAAAGAHIQIFSPGPGILVSFPPNS